MVEGGMTCVKYLLFAFNFVFFIFGAILIGVGAYVQIELSEYLNFFATGNVNATAILVIAVGALTLIIGFFGCCGAVRENSCMVTTFAVLIGLVLICEIGGGIAAFVLQSELEELLTDGMKEAMNKYDSDPSVQKTWDSTQQELKCCGSANYTDWEEIREKVPDSCCEDNKCGKIRVYYTDGCLDAIEKIVEENIVIIAGVAIGLGVVELLGIVLACCLGKSIREEYRYV